jgi:predicted permease
MIQILFIILLLLIGYLLRFAKFPNDFGKSLNLFVIYISVPATVLLQIPNIIFDSSLWVVVLAPWLVLVLSVVLVLWIFGNAPRNTKAALLLLIPLGNTSFFGFPMIEALMGNESLQYAIIYDQLGSFLILATYGAFIVSYFSDEKSTLKQTVSKIVLFPPFIALLVALLVGKMPEQSLPYLELLSHTLVPLAIIAVGFSMELKIGSDKSIFVKALALKLIAIPLIVFGVFRLMEIDSMVAQVTLLEVSMPSMITAGAMAIHAGFAPKLSASLVGYGIIVSLASIPLFFELIK